MSFARTLLLSVFLTFFGLLHAQTPVTIQWSPHPDPQVVGYKLHYGTTPNNPDTVIDTGASLSTTVLLQEGFSYYFSVSAYDIFGLESLRSAEVPFVLGTINPDHLIVIEPENGETTGSLSAGLFLSPFLGFIETLSAEPGTASVEFEAPADDDYSLWLRVQAPGSNSDSIKVGIGSEMPEQADLIQAPTTHSSDWQWVQVISNGAPRLFSMTAGTQILHFETVEAGLLIDRAVLTSDINFAPSDTNITNGDIIIISKHPETTTAPAGANLTLFVSLISSETPSFQWLKDGNPIIGENSPSINIAGLDYDDIGSYCVEIQTDSATVLSETAIISIQQIELPRLSSFEFIAGELPEDPPTVILHLAEGEFEAYVKVLASSDLIDWDDLGTFTLQEVSTISAFDPGAADQTNRFYKIVETSPPTP